MYVKFDTFLFLSYIFILSRITFVNSLLVFGINSIITLDANNEMLTHRLGWHRNYRLNNVVPYLLEVYMRMHLCGSILHHHTLNLNFNDNAPLQNTACITEEVIHADGAILEFRRIKLCICPIVLGEMTHYYLVKGPVNRSILVYARTANNNYINVAFATRIEDNHIYPNFNNEIPQRNQGNPSPPPRSSSSSNNNNNNNRHRPLIARYESFGAKRRRLLS